MLGQKVNFQKSNIHFSATVQQSVSDEISKEIGIQKTNNLGRYLGAPSIHGRAGKELFNHPPERVTKKLASWKTYAGTSCFDIYPLLRNAVYRTPERYMLCHKSASNAWRGTTLAVEIPINWHKWRTCSIRLRKSQRHWEGTKMAINGQGELYFLRKGVSPP